MAGSAGFVKPKGQRMEIAAARLVVCRLPPGEPLPGWALAGDWWSVSRSEAELSITCEERWVPKGVVQSGRWRALRVEGPLDHDLIGVLASIAQPLASAHIPIFAISTYDTDWVLVPEARLEQASAALAAAGHQVRPSPSVAGGAESLK